MNYFPDYNDFALANDLGGERFSVTYRISGSEKDAMQIANDICEEQTIEFPKAFVPDGKILSAIFGQIERFTAVWQDLYETEISFPVEIAASEFTQFLNVVFGNFSLKRNVIVTEMNLPQKILDIVKGPRFGIEGLRKITNAYHRPLLFSALKPMGLSATNLARVAGIFAENGIDIIKDDHGLTNQKFSPYRERIAACCDAVNSANAKTSGHTIYVPNITASVSELKDRAMFAKENGAGGLLIAPGLVSLDAMRMIAEDDEIGLPVFSHPAFIGSMVINAQGFSCQMLFGQLMRLAGADASVFPNYGGRFSLSVEECIGTANVGKRPLGTMKTLLACPAGGMQIDRIPNMLKNYGEDVALLIGGGLFANNKPLDENCKMFKESVEKLMAN